MEIIKEYWAILGAFVGFLVWLVRLEAGMLSNRTAITRMEKQRQEDIKRADAQRDKMDDNIKEIRTDIKQVLVLLSTKENRH